MALNRAFVEVKEFFDCFFVLLGGGKGSRNEVIPAFLPAFAVFGHQECPRRQFAHAFEDRIWRWCVPESQEKVDRNRIDFRLGILRSENCADLRAERKLSICEPIVDQLDPHSVTRYYQPLVRHIPDGETKHAVEVVKDIS